LTQISEAITFFCLSGFFLSTGLTCQIGYYWSS